MMNIKNLFASVGLISLVSITSLVATSTVVKASGTVRISGQDRYETAAKVAESNWISNKNVVLVSGEGYADAVSSAVLAKVLNAPILFTTSEALSQDTKNTIKKFNAQNIYIIGGDAAISKSIREELKKNYNLIELGGKNRYETNLVVANELVKNHGVKAENILVVGGQGFSDALSAAPVAAAKGEILLLADNDTKDMESTSDFIKENKSSAIIIGTENTINKSIYEMFSASDRIDGGTDRFQTNLKILDYYKNDLKNDKIYVADVKKDGYADALVASVLAGKYSVPLVFVGEDGFPETDSAISYINRIAYKYSTDINIIGGKGVLPDSIVDSINPNSSSNDSGNSSSSSSSSNNDDSDSSSNDDTSSNTDLQNATDAVNYAEDTHSQEDLDHAKDLVDDLPDGSDKDGLEDRIKDIQDEIDQSSQESQGLADAIAAVQKAEQTKTKEDYDAAISKVSAINDDDKTGLQGRLDKVKSDVNALIKVAGNAVTKAESTKTDEDINAAQGIIDKVPDGWNVSDLKEKLDKIKQGKESEDVQIAVAAVEKAENSKTQSDVDNAKKLVEALSNSLDKTSLENRLNILQNEINQNSDTQQQAIEKATQAVEKAESSKIQADVDSAKNLVEALQNSLGKTSLLDRLQIIQEEIDQANINKKALDNATAAVVKAEGSKIQEDVNNAKVLVNALVENSDKTSLLDRLQIVQNEIDQANAAQEALDKATTAVKKAEGSKLQVDVDNATALVDALANSTNKTSLQARLQVVQGEIDKANTSQEALTAATEAVVKAEGSKTQVDVDSAKNLVEALQDSSDKTSLLDRLQTVQEEINQANTDKDALDKATAAVVKAEDTEFKVDVDNAKTLVTALSDSADKTSLLSRLQAIQPIITTHQEFYEAMKNSLYNYDTTLDIYVDAYDLDKYNPGSTFDEIKIQAPDLIAGCIGTDNNTITTIIANKKYEIKVNFQYGNAKETLISKRDAVTSKVNQIVDQVTNSTMNNYEKELALHDYLVNNCQYDPRVSAGTIPDNSDDTYNAYGALINNVAVCQGYADAMYRLLKAVGIESMMVSGTASGDGGVSYGNHAWNMVKLGGQWYQLDPTFDDPTYSGHTADILSHDYFNVTDDFLSKDHIWDKSQYPACNSTEYSYK